MRPLRVVILAAAAIALHGCLTSCGLNSADVTYQRDGFEVHYISHPDGTQEIHYTELSTKRVFRSIRTQTGEWKVEVQDPNTGIWLKYESDSKSPDLSLSILPPEAAASINAK